MVSKRLGFSIIEILVVITIVGIITGISAPAYRDYMLRSKVDSMRSAAAGAQFAVQNDYFNNNKDFTKSNYDQTNYPDSSKIPAIIKPKLDFISEIKINNGIIKVIADAAKLNNKAIILTLTPKDNDGSITWICSCNNPDFYAYAPAECRKP